VAAIKAGADAEAVFAQIFDELVTPAVQLIKAGKHAEAYALYETWTRRLQRRYLHSKEA
jgi:hypothetical protein